MISVNVSPDGKPLSLAPSLPISVEVQEDACVFDVKTAIAAKFPRVSQDKCFTCHEHRTERPILALRVPPKTHVEG